MLVVAPLRVCQLVWEQEAKQWTQFRHLKFALLHGTNKKTTLTMSTADIMLINPEGVKWLCDQFWGRSLPFDIVTIDELTKFKNAQASRHKALLPRLKKVRYIWGLTGTPIPNGYLDLFGQMKILDGGASLGMYYSHFRDKYFEKDYTGFNYELRRGAGRAIEERIRPYVLRMSADDYLKLPPVITDVREIEMPKKARVVYESMRKEMIAELDDNVIEAGNAAAVYSKLKQMSNGAVYVGDGILTPREVLHLHDAKIEAVQELVEELAGTPVLIAYEFNHDLSRLLKALGNPPHLGEGVSGDKARIIERKWNNGEIPVLLAHPASAGHGLNFQKGNACHIAWFSTTWDYELYDQFMKRIVRQGNKAPRVFNHVFIVKNSLDIKTRDVIQEKGLTQSAFLDALNDEVYQSGKSAASPFGAHGKETDMSVKKLTRRGKAREKYEEEEEEGEEEEEEAPRRSRRSSRRTSSRRAAKQEEPEEEEEDEDGEEEEEEAPRRSRRSSRRSSGSTRTKLRGRRAAEEDEEEDGEEEEEEPAQSRGRRAFSKAVRERLEEDEDEDEDGEEEEEPEEEEEKPKRNARRSSTKGKTSTRKTAKAEQDAPPFDADGTLEAVKAQLAKRVKSGDASVDDLISIGHFFAMLDRMENEVDS